MPNTLFLHPGLEVAASVFSAVVGTNSGNELAGLGMQERDKVFKTFRRFRFLFDEVHDAKIAVVISEGKEIKSASGTRNLHRAAYIGVDEYPDARRFRSGAKGESYSLHFAHSTFMAFVDGRLYPFGQMESNNCPCLSHLDNHAVVDVPEACMPFL